MSGQPDSPREPLIRPARPADRDPILVFCKDTWHWGDYLEHVWDDWLAGEDGRLLVGEVAGRPIAVGRARLVAPGEGWLEGLRVDPSARRSGVGQAMTVATLGAARDLGARVVRFATRADALPVHRIAERLGFSKVASYHVLAASPLDDGGALPAALTDDRAGSVWRLVSGGQMAADTSPAHVWRHWHCRSLDPAEIRRRIADGQALGIARPGPLELEAAAFVVEEPDDGGLEVDLLVGHNAESIAALGLGLRRLAAERSLGQVEARALEVDLLIEALADAGYARIGEADAPFWIFEWRDS